MCKCLCVVQIQLAQVRDTVEHLVPGQADVAGGGAHAGYVAASTSPHGYVTHVS